MDLAPRRARTKCMTRLICAGVLVGAGVVPLASVSSSGQKALGAGLSVAVPRGWRVSNRPVTECGDPKQRFVAVIGRMRLHKALRIPRRAALVLVMEASSGRFPARPPRFVLPRRLGNLGRCCEIPTGPGAELLFRDRGRRFYAFVFVGERAPATARRDVVRLLDSLRVSVTR